MKHGILWIKLSLLFAVIFYTWITIHESSHVLVCSLYGFKPSLFQLLPHPIINCEGLATIDKILISPLQYFFFAITPYIIALILLLSVTLVKKLNIFVRYLLVSMLFLDVIYNYFIAIFGEGDFYNMAFVSKSFFLLSMGITLTVCFISIHLFKKEWKEFKAKIESSPN